MSMDLIVKEEDIKECSDEEKKIDPEICMTGIELPSVDDQNLSQRRHFTNKTSSNIFFCDMPKEDNVSSGNDSVDRKEIFFPSAGHDMRYADQKQLERRHFHSHSEDYDYVQPESKTKQGEQFDVSGAVELTEVEPDVADQNQTQRHHFHKKTTSDIFFRHLPTEGNISSGSAIVDREELLFPSAGHYTRYADQNQSERRHFHSSSENYTQPENNSSQDEQVDSSGTADFIKNETDHANQNQRHNFDEKMSSDIFFRHLSKEGNVSSGSPRVDREELLFPSAGHDLRYAEQKQLERRHFHSLSEDYMQAERDANPDKQADSSEIIELSKVERSSAVQNQTQRQHFHQRTSSDIFFCQLPTESKVSSGSASVDREELLFPSAGHYIRYADQKHGERRHFQSSEDYVEPGSNTNQNEQVDSSETTELVEVETHCADEIQTQRHHFHEKTSSDIFFRHLPTDSNESSESANVDREELLFPSAGHDNDDQKLCEHPDFHLSAEDYMQPDENGNCNKVYSSVTAESR